MIVAAAAAPLLFGCSYSAERDGISGSSQAEPIAGSTGYYGDYAWREPGRSRGSFDPYHTQCDRHCRALAGGQ